jgi:hypothetical protein
VTFFLSVTYKHFIQSIVMLGVSNIKFIPSVVMLSVT